MCGVWQDYFLQAAAATAYLINRIQGHTQIKVRGGMGGGALRGASCNVPLPIGT